MQAEGSSDDAVAAIDLFVVETPMQLLNALEAHSFFGSRRSTLLIVLTGAYVKALFDRLLSELPERPWTEIRFVRLKTRFAEIATDARWKAISSRLLDKYNELHRLLSRKRLEAQLASGPVVTRVFLGNYCEIRKSYLRHVANFTRPSEVILLDDGTEAIQINEQRIAWDKATMGHLGKSAQDGKHCADSLKRRLRKRHVDWDDRHVSTVTFFSAFALVTSDRDRLIRNDYRYLRSIRKSQNTSDEIYVIGQCLTEDGYLDAQHYARAVVDLCDRFAGKRVVYIPHPRESEDTVERVARAASIVVRRLDVPVEFFLLTAPILPRGVASFCSTALVNCSVIFGQALTIYGLRLDLNSLLRFRSEVTKTYAHLDTMRSDTFQILD